jgi:iron-sulfur cluster repair protein YtfE (RIC family)
MSIFSRLSETDAPAFLKQQHEEVSALFKEFESSKSIRVFDTIQQKLAIHTAIEEEIFYPAVKRARAEQTGEEVAEALEEHYQIKLVIRDIDDTRPSGDSLAGKMKCLKEDVEHHVSDEENEMFPDARKYLGEERLEALGNELRKRFSELEKRGVKSPPRSVKASTKGATRSAKQPARKAPPRPAAKRATSRATKRRTKAKK